VSSCLEDGAARIVEELEQKYNKGKPFAQREGPLIHAAKDQS
jgi:hypothetical protein